MKRIAAYILIIALFITLVPALETKASSDVYTKAVVLHGVNFRDAPSTSGTRLRSLIEGEVVHILGQADTGWYHIRDSSGQIGYVSNAPKYLEITTNGRILFGVNLRTGPSTNDSIIRSLRAGEEVLVLSRHSANWFEVRDMNGVTGYMSSGSKYIETTYTEPVSAPPVQDEEVIEQPYTKAVVRFGVNFRTGPSTSGARIRSLEVDEVVYILGQADTGWYHIQDASGQTGYVSNAPKYLEIVTNGRILFGVNFRTGPSTGHSIIRSLRAGEEVLVLSQHSANWYEVRDMNGVTGYMSAGSKYIETTYQPPAPEAPPANSAPKLVDQVIQTGMKYMGTPYKYGSDRNDPSSFDCSDFIRWIFRESLGIVLPFDSRQQGNYVKGVSPVKTNIKDLERGDLVFFMSYLGTSASSYSGVNKSTATITHVGIYLGNGEILHTYSAASGGVRVDQMMGRHWEYRFLFGGSAIEISH